MARQQDPQLQQHVVAIRKMRIGDSVFVPDVRTDALEYLRKPVERIGVKIELVRVECDEIYQGPGVRLYRREGTYDEL